MILGPVYSPTLNMERLCWNAFKKQARKQDPVASKVDYRYYERLRAAYKAQKDKNICTLDRWVVNGILSKGFPERTTEENQ